MSGIERWSHEHPTDCVQVRYDLGDWVRYDDHAAEVELLEATFTRIRNEWRAEVERRDEVVRRVLAVDPVILAAVILADDFRRMHAEGAIDLDLWPAARGLITALEVRP